MDDPDKILEPAVQLLSEQVNEAVRQWYDAMNSADFAGAESITVSALREVRRLESSCISPALKNYVHGCRIILNGFCDVAGVCVISTRKDWVEQPKVVEEIWASIHNGKDRLTAHPGLDDEFVAECLGFLEPAFIAIQERYGSGIYLSWELVLDGLNCTICNQDIRACDHVGGQWYDGQECNYDPVGGHIAAISFVENPRDPRCRLWPWRKTGVGENGSAIFKCPVYIIFTPEGGDDDRQTLNLEALFA